MEDISNTRTEVNNNLNMEERLQSQSSTPHLHNATEDVTLLWYGDWYIYVTVVEIIMSIIILVGNGLVIAAYITDRKLRTVTNFFLVNLVIADFTVGLALPISCGIFYMKDRMSPHLCTIQFTVLGEISIFTTNSSPSNNFLSCHCLFDEQQSISLNVINFHLLHLRHDNIKSPVDKITRQKIY